MVWPVRSLLISTRCGTRKAENGNALDLERMAKDSRNNVRDCLMRLEVELMAL